MRAYECPICGRDAASAWRVLGYMRGFKCPHCSAALKVQGWLNLAVNIAIAFMVPLGGAVALVLVGGSSALVPFGMVAAAFVGGSLIATLPVLAAYLHFVKLKPAGVT